MVRFLIYLFESGMCLTLLFLVYYFFLRKETYFTFNRIYLLSILVFSLLLPLFHLNFTLPESESLKNRVTEIDNFKNYYENLIALTDPDYANSFTKPFQKNKTEEFAEGEAFAFKTESLERVNSISVRNSKNIKTGFWADLNIARILLILYLLGILFFVVRLLLLFVWLNQTIRKYGSTNENEVKMVKMEEEVPPFSFFRFVFFNREMVSHSGFAQILVHEKVHIQQRHSVDLMLAHLISVFQWFNPFVWLINRAMKTNHEYIADRNVVEQGYELFDYQSFLLEQMISIRSVELVNNFNLINIKKRIAMMTKIKSGLAAQLKALVVIPAAIFLFFFFAEITFAQKKAGFENKVTLGDLQGFWENTNNDTYGKLLNFDFNRIQILEDKDSYKDLEFMIPQGVVSGFKDQFQESKISEYVSKFEDLSMLVVKLNPERNGNWDDKPIFITIKNNKLIVEWSKSQVSVYRRLSISNSLEQVSEKISEDFKPVSLEYYRIAENPEKTFHLLMNKNGQMLLDNKYLDLDDLQKRLWEKKSEGNPFDSWGMTPILVIDARCPMEYVNQLYTKMREINELRYIISVKPFDEKVPEIFYHNVGIPRVLPPKDAKLVDEKKIEASGMKILRIDLTKGEMSRKPVAEKLEKGIRKGEKYVILFIYENETSYKEYLTILDEIYEVVFAKRNKLAQEKHNLPYDELAKAQQKEIRKVFPLIVTERNVDQKEK